jgi:3-hydroxy acid dehydrogenase / malonic semialdehyde reductase
MRTVKRTVLITGASSGIGRAIARLLLQQGHHIIGTSRDGTKFTTSMTNFTPLVLDLNHPERIPEQIRRLEKQFPELDTVIFNAGIGQFGSLEEFSYPQIDNLITVNFTSQVVLTKALLPSLKKKPTSDLIYIGSEAALKGSRKGAVYCASKFALRGFTQALREECSKSNVRVCLINPGMVKTPFFDALSFEPGDDDSHYLLAEDVADVVGMVLASRTHAVIDEINLNPLNKVIKFKKT